MIVCFALFLSLAHAQVFEGPVDAALGGSGRAGLDANEGAYLNPALVSLQPKSEVAGYYRDGDASNLEHRTAWGVSLSENNEDVLFPGQVSYIRTRVAGLTPNPANAEIWYLAAGKLIYKKFAIGLSAYEVNQSVAGQSLSLQFNGAIGGVFLITHDIGIAYVFENPAHASGDIPAALRLSEQQSVGAFYSMPYSARLRLDVIEPLEANPNQRVNLRTSIESAFSEFFVFRFGARWDEVADQRYLTAGLGFNGPMLKLDYGVEKNLAGTGGAVHSVDLRMTF